MPRGGSRIGAGRCRLGETVEEKRARQGLKAARDAAKAPPPSGPVIANGADLDDDLSPLDFLKAIQRNKALPIETRIRAAMAAAPYTHAKLRDAGMGIKDERKKKGEAAAGSSRLAPGVAPVKLVPKSAA